MCAFQAFKGQSGNRFSINECHFLQHFSLNIASLMAKGGDECRSLTLLRRRRFWKRSMSSVALALASACALIASGPGIGGRSRKDATSSSPASKLRLKQGAAMSANNRRRHGLVL